jgi:hypothetical protein
MQCVETRRRRWLQDNPVGTAVLRSPRALFGAQSDRPAVTMRGPIQFVAKQHRKDLRSRTRGVPRRPSFSNANA